MRLAAGVLSIENFQDALELELFGSRGLVPEDANMPAFLARRDAAEWAHRRCVGEFVPVQGQVVTVRKSGHGVRPVVELAVRDRLLYRALVRRWAPALSEPDRSSGAYVRFLQAPLEADPVPAYVVSSDVTAFYEYIDHGILAREVLARTGDVDGVEALTSLLAGVMGRSFGLPQQSGASDVLAEAYLAVVERRLLRQGLTVWRYNDDFRIAVESWSAALKAVDALERECRSIGLALNDLKTFIRKGQTYRDSVSRRDEVLEDISGEVMMDLSEVVRTRYDEIVIEPAQDEVTAGAAQAVVAEWLNLEDKMLSPDPELSLSPKEQDKRAALVDLLRWAVPVLQGRSASGEIMRACAQILRAEQTLTPLVARFLELTADPVATISWFEEFLSGNPYLTPWQVWWIAPAMGALEGSFASGSQQRRWIESVWRDRSYPEPVIAGIAFTIARKEVADVGELIQVFESMTDVGRPYLARAIGALASPDDSRAETLLDEDELIKWAFESGRVDA